MSTTTRMMYILAGAPIDSLDCNTTRPGRTASLLPRCSQDTPNRVVIHLTAWHTRTEHGE